MKEFERKYEDLGYVCGIDEVGRGPFAGPVVAAAVILPKDCDILYLNDSKKRDMCHSFFFFRVMGQLRPRKQALTRFTFVYFGENKHVNQRQCP